eukprot:EG_transcript_10945
MPSHYCTIPEADSIVAKKSTWRTVVLAVGACAVSAVALNAVLPTNTLYASTTSRAVQPIAVMSTAPAGEVVTRRQAVQTAAPALQTVTTNRVDSNTVVGLTAVASGMMMLLAAGVPVLRQYFAPASKSVAMASTTGATEKEQMRQLVAKLDPADMRLLSRGGSMADVVRSKGIDEVAQAIRADQLSRKDLTPKDVILEMQRGNGRFWMGLSERPDMDAMSRRALIMAQSEWFLKLSVVFFLQNIKKPNCTQAPKICILSCSDSRVPVSSESHLAICSCFLWTARQKCLLLNFFFHGANS